MEKLYSNEKEKKKKKEKATVMIKSFRYLVA